MTTPRAEAACALIDAASVRAWGRTSASLLASSEKNGRAETWAELVESPLACFLFLERLLFVIFLFLFLCSQLEGGENLLVGPNKVPQVGGILKVQLQQCLLLCFQLVVYLSVGSHVAFLLRGRWMFELLLQFLAVCFQLIWTGHRSVETPHLLSSTKYNINTKHSVILDTEHTLTVVFVGRLEFWSVPVLGLILSNASEEIQHLLHWRVFQLLSLDFHPPTSRHTRNFRLHVYKTVS